jgi:two-component system chemotaxis sensor kinase CheA
MNPLLVQFLSEASDCLEGIAAKLMQLEKRPGDSDLMNELFRFVHTLKGNSGLFDFPEMTRVLHAAEDLMDAVRTGAVRQTKNFTDEILDAMDFVGGLTREIEAHGHYADTHRDEAVRIAHGLRALLSSGEAATSSVQETSTSPILASLPPQSFQRVPEAVKAALSNHIKYGESCFWIVYKPEEGCFFQGDDPFYLARHTPGQIWGCVENREPWAPPAALDPYRCIVDFQILAVAFKEELADHFRYVPDQVEILEVLPQWLHAEAGAQTSSDSNPASGMHQAGDGLSEEIFESLTQVFRAQRVILDVAQDASDKKRRLSRVGATLLNCAKAIGQPPELLEKIAALAKAAQESGDATALLTWMQDFQNAGFRSIATAKEEKVSAASETRSVEEAIEAKNAARSEEGSPASLAGTVAKSLKVDQVKIDRLMNLIGELVVSKNAIPYLAQRAENQFGVRELSREIKSQYSVINRIAEEMQDAIMQIRMMPVSVVFQRFPRLVRDISRKLGKEVSLVLEGEETEADKNIIEALADPLIHIVRNSLDHGLETPEVRKAQGKPATGTLTIRATQEADRAVIEITDDGKGINPEIIKRKAYEKGVIDEETLGRISDEDAIHLIFAAGFSTAEVVSDLSGRGVGMDVVRSAVEKINGTIDLQSQVGKGTRLRISLPLSMAVTQVMIIESDGQIFGVPMDHVVETVRVPRSAVRVIKSAQMTLLRGRLVPLKTLNTLLRIPAKPQTSADDEYAVLVVRVGTDTLGVIVDEFRETVDVIQKPMTGVLSGLQAYSGSALMGDGSVLMVLNLKEII